MATSLDMSLDDLIKSKRNSERGRGRGRTRAGRARGGTSIRGRAVGMLPRGVLKVKTRPSGFTIAKRQPINYNASSWSFYAEELNLSNFINWSSTSTTHIISLCVPSSRTKDFSWQHDLFEDSMVAAGYSGIETGTKLYVSNLHSGVTNEDIKELFSEVGNLKRYTVHYDSNGRSSGSAEVVFTRGADALAAMKRYNNVQLDGKAMKIEIIGTNLGTPMSARVNVRGGANGRGKRTVVMGSELVQPRIPGSFINRGGISKRNRGLGGSQRGRGNARTRGGGRGRGRGHGRKQATEKSAVELDKELESYHAEAMQT